MAAAAGRRAAAVASAATTSPVGPSTARLKGDSSPARRGQSPDRAASPVQLTSGQAGGLAGGGQAEVRCVEGYGQNLYVGGSDGVVEWWVCDGGSSSQVSPACRLYPLCSQVSRQKGGRFGINIHCSLVGQSARLSYCRKCRDVSFSRTERCTLSPCHHSTCCRRQSWHHYVAWCLLCSTTKNWTGAGREARSGNEEQR